MDIQKVDYNIHSQAFRAKVPLKNKELLKGTTFYNSTTPLDNLFNENCLVKGLNNFSEKLKKNILCKYFQAPSNFLTKFLAKAQYKTIISARILSDRIFLASNKNAINTLNDGFVKLDSNSKEYIEEFAKLGNSIDNKYIVTNSEDKILEKVADTDTATIFAMNHPNYNKDKFTYAIINSILNKLYIAKNKQATCPRPKILVSRNMLNIIHPKIANIYNKMGLIPVDASVPSVKDAYYNARIMKKLLIEFCQDKSNIFFFPEGNNSSYKNKPLEEKIQQGIADFVEKALAHKPNVRVIPIGINYNFSKNNLGKIYIGKPLLFTKNNSINSKADRIKERNAILKIICNHIKYGMEKAKTLE